MNITVEEALDKLRATNRQPGVAEALTLLNEFLQTQERIADNLSMLVSSIQALEQMYRSRS